MRLAQADNVTELQFGKHGTILTRLQQVGEYPSRSTGWVRLKSTAHAALNKS
jgi:hypothetical protein